MTTINVSLLEQMKDWGEAQVQGGRYANSSDYVRDLIRRDQTIGKSRKDWIERLDTHRLTTPGKLL